MNINKDMVLECLTLGPTLVCATKYLDLEKTNELIDLGVKDIGENRVEALLAKLDGLHPCKIHFIGHLQRNKVKKIINKIDCLHSLDSLELAKIINEERSLPLDTFIEVNLGEEQKNGVEINLLDNFIQELKKYDKINLLGLMGMAHDTNDRSLIEEDFKTLEDLKNKFNLPCLSMGMSNDYDLAIKHGATHIRLGRILLLED